MIGGLGFDNQKKERAERRDARRSRRVGECVSGFRSGSCDSAQEVTSGNHRLLLERVKAADGMRMWRRRAESHFLILAKERKE